jgi:hypothetical protein
MAVMEYFDGLQTLQPGDSPGNLAYQIGIKRMKVFLELEGDGHTGVPGWNKKGSIDEFAAKWIGVEGQTAALGRLAGVFLRLIEELLVIESTTEEQLPEQWQWQVDGVLDNYALVLIGISPPQQMLM